MTIGIIEDDTLLHQALKTALQNAGYQTVSAYTKQEALTTITGSESLLLIDIGLPDGNGFPDKKQVYKNEKEIILTAREYQLLEYLMYNQGNVLTKENILEYVWGLVNYFNIMFTGIVGRKKELEIMRKIGMTRRQERKLLLLEGSYYVLLVAGLVASVGSIILKGSTFI